ncbi:MAG: hypothetical protein EOP84_16425 [Verrucomicrobiaceae bacterium]|nr:MAG: hypothetical protein EOP84_16425 [Verrucomicrobiaceae bacterium]
MENAKRLMRSQCSLRPHSSNDSSRALPYYTPTMSRPLITLLICVIAIVGAWSLRARVSGKEGDHPEDRVQQARLLREEKLRKLCSDNKLSYPPRRLFLRAMKWEQILEVWAGDDENKPLQLLVTYPLTAFSGKLGPKRREGDYQIPEGVYRIDRFNPRSSFHLSLGLNYPNESDRQLSDPKKPGSDIFIHGRAASVGCLAIGDEAIEELYVLARDVPGSANGKITVHIFPARMNDPEWKPAETREAKANPEILTFWESLLSIYNRFEETRKVPEVEVEKGGVYRLRDTAQ